MPGLENALRYSKPRDLDAAKCWLGHYAGHLNRKKLGRLKDAATDGERKLAVGLNSMYLQSLGEAMTGNFPEFIELNALPSEKNTANQLCFVSESFIAAVKAGRGTPGELLREIADRQDFSAQYRNRMAASFEHLGVDIDLKSGPLKTLERVRNKAKEYFEENVDSESDDLIAGKRFARLNNKLSESGFGKAEGRTHYLTPDHCEFAILDFVRCSITCGDAPTVLKLFHDLQKRPGVLGYKNGFDFRVPPPPSNYRDIKFLLKIPFACDVESEPFLDEGQTAFHMICELQIMLAQWLEVKAINSTHYKVRRANNGAALQQDCSKYIDRCGKTPTKEFQLTPTDKTRGEKEGEPTFAAKTPGSLATPLPSSLATPLPGRDRSGGKHLEVGVSTTRSNLSIPSSSSGGKRLEVDTPSDAAPGSPSVVEIAFTPYAPKVDAFMEVELVDLQ